MAHLSNSFWSFRNHPISRFSTTPTMWGPPVISWFISPSNYIVIRCCKYHKTTAIGVPLRYLGGPHIAGTMAPPHYDASSLPQRVAHWRLLFAVLASVEPQRSELRLGESKTQWDPCWELWSGHIDVYLCNIYVYIWYIYIYYNL